MPTPTTRRCPGCSNVYPATADYFYRVPSTGRFTRCRGPLTSGCHEAYYAARSAVRRNGTTTRRSANPRFGVEIEFVGTTRERVALALCQHGLQCANEQYNHSTCSYWKVITDGSVPRGGELVSPPLRGEEGLRQIEIACRALASVGAHPDASTGLHVHHEMARMTANSFIRAFEMWAANESLIHLLVAPSRRRSQWCGPLRSHELESIRQSVRAFGIGGRTRRRISFSVDRYHALNVQSYPRYGTVEIRLHQGSANARKINAWVQFGQAFFALARSDQPVQAFASIDVLLDALVEHAGLSADTATYLKRRAVTLGPSNHGERRPVTVDADGERCGCGEMLVANGVCPTALRREMASV